MAGHRPEDGQSSQEGQPISRYRAVRLQDLVPEQIATLSGGMLGGDDESTLLGEIRSVQLPQIDAKLWLQNPALLGSELEDTTRPRVLIEGRERKTDLLFSFAAAVVNRESITFVTSAYRTRQGKISEEKAPVVEGMTFSRTQGFQHFVRPRENMSENNDFDKALLEAEVLADNEVQAEVAEQSRREQATQDQDEGIDIMPIFEELGMEPVIEYGALRIEFGDPADQVHEQEKQHERESARFIREQERLIKSRTATTQDPWIDDETVRFNEEMIEIERNALGKLTALSAYEDLTGIEFDGTTIVRFLDRENPLPTPDQQAQFDELADQVEEMIGYGEQLTHIGASRAWQEIEAIGMAAVQPILIRLSRGNPVWYMPLDRIISHETGNYHTVQSEPGDFWDPKAPKRAYTQFEGDKRAWLKWGKENGYYVEIDEETQSTT